MAEVLLWSFLLLHEDNGAVGKPALKVGADGVFGPAAGGDPWRGYVGIG